MGVGPAYAIPIAVRQAGLQLDDIDVFEINEVCSFVFLSIYLSVCLSVFFILFILFFFFF